MAPRRPIDERDIDDLLASLTDRQIADLFEMTEAEVSSLRRQWKREGEAAPEKHPKSSDADDTLED